MDTDNKNVYISTFYTFHNVSFILQSSFWKNSEDSFDF